jgi:hypothetical protein
MDWRTIAIAEHAMTLRSALKRNCSQFDGNLVIAGRIRQRCKLHLKIESQ